MLYEFMKVNRLSLFRPKFKKDIKTLVLLMMMCLISSCLQATSREFISEKLTLSFLDIGQGDALLIQYSDGYYMVDAGGDSCGLKDTLLNREIYQLEWIMISHFDLDHFGGLLGILNDSIISINEVIVLKDSSLSWHADSLMRTLKKRNIAIREVSREDSIGGFGRFNNRILWPLENRKVDLNSDMDDDNHNSIVLKISDNYQTLLMTGDVDSLAEDSLLELEKDLKVSILKVSHHGSASATTLNFLEKILPDWAVISVGKNSYGHPHPSVLADLNLAMNDSSRILITMEKGTIEFEWFYDFGIVQKKTAQN